MIIKDQFKEYLHDFCTYLYTLKNYSELTVKTYKSSILDTINLSELHEEDGDIILDITKFRIKIAKQSPKTINKKLSSLQSFINYLKTKNIEVHLKGVNTIKIPESLPKPIGTDNIFQSLKEATLEEKLIIVFIYSFGLRISELASLKLINIKQEWISVIGKGDKQREIPSNEVADSIYKEYLKNFHPKIYLFEKNSKPMSVRQLQYRVEKAFKKVGIKATPHQLRHSFATDLLNDGARINDISELLGHSSLKATGIYTKLNTNTKLKQYNMSHPLNKK